MNYYEELYEFLSDPEEALSYLKAAAKDKDQIIFLLALNNIIKAYDKKIATKQQTEKL